ncbi:thiamine-phosphate kinase [Calditerrivibrio sp.]|uniref:Thiamine-monophosphate kinase n=1 Tax=Calditerrivibrio nitroreducens TaxID=477976 RepID=A0A2J6WQX4_9BACT|nr:MAG: thiamine-phosphate kinase [Calditerrivibrio nitroreducens]
MKEFEFIKKLSDLNRYYFSNKDLGIGDDAALLGEFLIAKDLIVSDVHFKREAGLRNILFKLITSNVSDIAAMGGTQPFYALLGLSTDGSIDLENFITDLKYVLDYYRIDLIGGDTTGSVHGIFLSLTIIGRKNRFLLKRTTARSGDILFLSRPVGLSKLSLEKELGIAQHSIHPHYHYNQKAEVALGGLLGSLNYVTSCIDISDGLGRDLSHISEGSKVKIIVEEKYFDISYLEKFNIKNPFDYILSSGEEYALAFTIDKNYSSEFKIYRKQFPDILEIGFITDGEGVFLRKKDNSLVDISRYGYEHL